MTDPLDIIGTFLINLPLPNTEAAKVTAYDEKRDEYHLRIFKVVHIGGGAMKYQFTNRKAIVTPEYLRDSYPAIYPAYRLPPCKIPTGDEVTS